VCSEEFCNLLAALTDKDAIEIANNWYFLRNPHYLEQRNLPPRLPHRARFHSTVLVELARLARIALATRKKLMLRVEYLSKPRSKVLGD
jgi:hypothetical protein